MFQDPLRMILSSCSAKLHALHICQCSMCQGHWYVSRLRLSTRRMKFISGIGSQGHFLIPFRRQSVIKAFSWSSINTNSSKMLSPLPILTPWRFPKNPNNLNAIINYHQIKRKVLLKLTRNMHLTLHQHRLWVVENLDLVVLRITNFIWGVLHGACSREWRKENHNTLETHVFGAAPPGTGSLKKLSGRSLKSYNNHRSLRTRTCHARYAMAHFRTDMFTKIQEGSTKSRRKTVRKLYLIYKLYRTESAWRIDFCSAALRSGSMMINCSTNGCWAHSLELRYPGGAA